MINKKYLRLKWTVSRGRDSYGYNICSLYVDGTKVSSCNGGGYDMQGTVIANYIQAEYQGRLLKIRNRAASIYSGKDYKDRKKAKNNVLYGMTYYKKDKEISLNGACGISSIERIIEAIHLKLTCLNWKDGTYLLEGIGRYIA